VQGIFLSPRSSKLSHLFAPSCGVRALTTAFINAIGTAVPEQDVHDAFIGWASARV